ncbi:MAG: LpqB family beta-propeller domain-containing protein, partial [Actinomycetes bacterium]
GKPPQLYFISQGRVVDSRGKPVPGGAGHGRYNLSAVALAPLGQGTGLRVAARSGSGANARLYLGTTGGALTPTAVTGRLSRPSWTPDGHEVWIGDGAKLYRVTAAGAVSEVSVTAANGKVSGMITAVRVDPGGVRVAMVVTASDGTAQVWVGAIVRSAKSVRVSNAQPISPQGVVVTDVAWNDQLKLFAIGHEKSTGDPSVYELQCDGSLWNARGIGNLPQAPDSITVAENVVAAVSTGPTVYEQSGGSWTSPNTGPTYGTNPVYVE